MIMIIKDEKTYNENFTHFSTYKSFKYDYFFSMSKYKA